jgi:hypothetical protein
MICALQAVLMQFKTSAMPIIGVTSNCGESKTPCFVNIVPSVKDADRTLPVVKHAGILTAQAVVDVGPVVKMQFFLSLFCFGVPWGRTPVCGFGYNQAVDLQVLQHESPVCSDSRFRAGTLP